MASKTGTGILVLRPDMECPNCHLKGHVYSDNKYLSCRDCGKAWKYPKKNPKVVAQ